jgi:hypothetical protein
MGHRYWYAYTLDHLGDLCHAAGRRTDAVPAWRDALSIYAGLQYAEADTIRRKLAAHSL